MLGTRLFGEFMISPIHYILYITELSVLGLCLQINDCGLFSLTALFSDLF